MAELRLERVSKAYGSVPAVQDISLTLPGARTMTVVGPSGCGKSTLLRLIAGLERPDSGDIHIGGERVTAVEPRARDVAMVFQSYALYPHMRVRENISVALRLRGVPRDAVDARVTRAAGMLGLGHLLDRRPRELSGGERQRVALARALVRDPKLFLLDEPLSNLDALLREHAQTELKALFQRLAATVVYVTHDQVEALALSDLVAVMRQGRLEQVGSPEEVYSRPSSVFVATFVGTPRMNLLPGDLLPGGAATVGIRPADVLMSAGGGPGRRLELTVSVRESLGAHHVLTLQSDGVQLRALVPAADAATVGSTVTVTLDPSRAHYFDHAGQRMDVER